MFDAHKVAKRINGTFLKDKTLKVGDKDKAFKAGDPVPGFALLQDDGSTCSGNWIYCASYTDKNMRDCHCPPCLRCNHVHNARGQLTI